MLLDELIQGLNIRRTSAPGTPSVRICDLTEDSRTTLPGSLFIARAGLKTDGRRYIEQAIASGAAAILTDGSIAPPERPGDVVWLTADDVPTAEAMLAERFFGYPSRRLTLIGTTGTNGKTTVTHLIHQWLNSAGVRCGQMGTVTIDDGGRVSKAAMTTPPAIENSYTFSKMLENGCRAAAIEVSSHALDQKRVCALDFNAAIFTNLTGDHLDYHGTMERYTEAKARLFEMLRPEAWAIVNMDDPAHRAMLARCRARVLRCSTLDAPGADCTAHTGPAALSGTPVVLRGPWGTIEGYTRLIGAYNTMNLLQAAAAAHTAGVSLDDLALHLFTLRAPPGRLDLVEGSESPLPFCVFVDYAHTDDALAKALDALRPLQRAAGGRLIVVFGCGGDRDRTKRPRMAHAACNLADEIIITSDNPRTEKPHAIISDILSGVPHEMTHKVRVDADRRTAIESAIEACRPGDVLLIAGKGHEDYQLLPDGSGGIVRIDFDDRETARAAIDRAARLARTSAEASV